ncbi:hypothetical protein MUN74_11825 [Agromyces endophyticus]|uniref:hypothetical protein n=1 Tax=Agromyces sp. H17E-10 TaxID=2932244 RepID=UPI001FD0034C|nr:hypothetical protein [Agromyces sp. H17E-10]UOQ87984.1 hypothetical protein MUN74_11825 [Agromyces sp. H17E-10]
MDPLFWIVAGVLALLVIVMIVRSLQVRRQPPSEGVDAERAELERRNGEHRREREREGPDIGSAGMG